MIISGDVSYGSYDYFTNHFSNYCIETFTYDRCYDLRISNHEIYGACLGVNIVGFFLRAPWLRKYLLSWWSGSDEFKYQKFRTLGTFCIHIVMITLIVYPAIVSGWLLSTNSVVTK